MSRIQKKVKDNNVITEFVTIISNLIIDPRNGILHPEELQNQTLIQFGIPGNVIIKLDFIDSENRIIKQNFLISRSGVNFGIPKLWVDEIKIQVDNQSGFKFTKPFILLETGNCNGKSIAHYSKTDLQILQDKLNSSAYLKTTYLNLLSEIEPVFEQQEEYET